MSKLDEAQQRLSSALAALEAAIGAPGDGNGDAAGAAGLAAELAETQARCTEMENSNAVVSSRLDSAIERIRSILDD